jgi:DNA mismatch repair protein MutL
MGTIRVLSEIVANKIAAGEVVERPASIVKELVENSIDAGAQSIAVWAGYGGKGLIRVKDDGCGMDAEDARTCLLRHATSKITDADDIGRIATLGFRGEALPSIASVSRLTLTTRRSGDDAATIIKTAGGVVESVSQCVAEPGTTLEVADLFFNTPARRKFLKSDPAEYSALAEIFMTICLSRSSLSFSLRRNNELVADYPACADLLERIGQLYSTDFSEKLYPVTIDKTDFKLHGYVSAPDTTRINRTGQKFFINGRPVQSAGLSMALTRAYSEFLPRGRFPVAFLFLDIPSDFVDVNVHPAKREVRLRTESYFQDLIVQAIKKELHGKGFFLEEPAGRIPQEMPRESAFDSRAPLRFNSFREEAATWQTHEKTALTGREPAGGSRPPAAILLDEAISRQRADGKPFDSVRVTGQMLGMYIIAEKDGEIAVFDQHAAHERILYEELLASLKQHTGASQKMIFPVTMHLGLQEGPIMERSIDYFQQLGFGINSLGGGSYAIDAVPSCMTDIDPAAVVKDTLHELMEGHAAKAFESRLQELAAILACKTYAVKAGKALTLPEMEHLVKRLGAADNPHICPHGRPTFFIVTRQELERRFKRT